MSSGATIVFLGALASLVCLCQLTSACWLDEATNKRPANCYDCGSGALIKQVEFSGCNLLQNDRCRIMLGKNHTVKITFVPSQYYEELYVNVWGRIVLLPMRFPLDPERVCDSYNVTCPLKPDQQVTFELELFFDSNWPRLAGTATFELYSPRSNYNEYTRLVCGQIRFQLVDEYSWRGRPTHLDLMSDTDLRPEF